MLARDMTSIDQNFLLILDLESAVKTEARFRRREADQNTNGWFLQICFTF